MTIRPHSLAGLYLIRQATGHRPTDLAQAIGVTTTSYFRYECGSRPIMLHKAMVLAQELGVTVDDLTNPNPEEALLKRLNNIRDEPPGIVLGVHGDPRYKPGRTVVAPAEGTYEKIAAGLEDAIAIAKGPTNVS